MTSTQADTIRVLRKALARQESPVLRQALNALTAEAKGARK